MFSRLLSSRVFARPHPAHLLLLQLEDLLLHFGDLPVHAVHALDELLLGQLGGRRVLVLPQVGRMPAWGRGLHFDAVLGLLNHSQPKASMTSIQMKTTSIKQQHHDGSTQQRVEALRHTFFTSMLALRLSWTAWGRGIMMPPVVEGARAMWDSEMVSMRGRLASSCSTAWAVKERNCISKPWQFSGGLGREQQWLARWFARCSWDQPP